MAYPPTQVVISYGSSSTATLTIPGDSNYSDFVEDIFKAGGFWYPQPANAPQSQTQIFTPWSEITSITAE